LLLDDMNAKNTEVSADEKPEVIFGLLEAVESNEAMTQRSVALELGVALGLVNTYLKRCVKKGLIKVQQVPPRRYAYYLTPKGFREKSRLTAKYLSSSLSFFRRAREDCDVALEAALQRRMKRVALVGAGDLAEICAFSALESAVTVAAIIVDENWTGSARLAGLDLVEAGALNIEEIDGLILTAMSDHLDCYRSAVELVGEERVIVPDLLLSLIRSPAGFDGEPTDGESEEEGGA
jgi:predicted transcriptional regulator